MTTREAELTPEFVNNAIAGLAASQAPDDVILATLTAYKTTPIHLLRVILAHQRGVFRSDVKNPDAFVAAAAAKDIMEVVSPYDSELPEVGDHASSSGPFVPTAEHQAIFRAAATGKNIVVRALAGSGKTTTMVKMVEQIVQERPAVTILCLAFSKPIVEAMKERLPKEVISSTIHSLCWQALQRSRGWRYGENRLQDKRTIDAAAAVLGSCTETIPDRLLAGRELKSLWALCRATMTDTSDAGAVADTAARYGAQITSGVFLCALVAAVDDHLRSDRDSASYDEMLTAVIDDGIALKPYDVVVIDEAQDLNALQIEIVRRCRPGQVIAVGDPHQAIFGWRGADMQAMDSLANVFAITTSLPLSVTYRCGEAIVREANRLVPALRARPGAPVGSVMTRRADQLDATIASLRPGDMVLCRTNAPLLPALFRTNRLTKMKCAILGNDQGHAVRDHLESACNGNLSLSSFETGQRLRGAVQERMAQLQSVGQIGAATKLQDDMEMAIALLAEQRTAGSAMAAIRDLFTNTVDRRLITFTSIHKAKGLEADRVVLLAANQIPLPRILASKNQPLIDQESHLLYVAITRAKHLLVLQEAA